ncbi:putative membrane-anchored protein [Planomicrobium stackebrandtii]|uniref:Membrane-anchored protein n=1 Tax=Planomicrobium stackebrandtii TaxID=253160 RepID=A0ABU0GYF6_9BACL|nr:putative membrane-anchored protein [Planomicrobium stackebrandtii]
MKRWITCLLIGLIMFMSGIYLSTLLSTTWIIIGVLLGVLGGILMGSSTYFLPKLQKK